MVFWTSKYGGAVLLMSKKKERAIKQILISLVLIILVLFLTAVVFVYIYGATPEIDEGIPDIGIDEISVPFSGEGQETIPIQWRLEGGKGLSGVYYSASSKPPETTAYTYFSEGDEVELPNRIKIIQANLPNKYAVNFVRIYAKMNNEEYWTEEYVIAS